MVSYSTCEATHIFVLKKDLSLEKVSTISIFLLIKEPCYLMSFSDDSRELYMLDLNNKLCVLDLMTEKLRVLHDINESHGKSVF